MGAWEYGTYRAVTRAWDNARLGAACIALKKELAFNGYKEGLVLDTPVLGDAFTKRLNEFKTARGLTPNGRVDSITSKELFKKRIDFIEFKYGLPYGTIGKKIKLESAFDPVAVGTVDPSDKGLCQINTRIHNVTTEQAFSPSFCVEWAAKYLSGNYKDLAERVNILLATRASYNIGVDYAYRWMMDDFPPAGGFFGGSEIDWYKRATEYIELIDKQTW